MVEKSEVSPKNQNVVIFSNFLPRPARRLYSISELAKDIGASPWFWRYQIWSGKLPVLKVGTKQFVDMVDVEKFISDHKSIN